MRLLESLFKIRQRAEAETAELPDLMLLAERAVASVVQGHHRQKKPGSGERFWQFRDYDLQDRPQDIDWKQSAKGERIYVREKEWENTQIGLFWCSSYPGMDFSSAPQYMTKKDVAHILSLALSLLLTRAGEQIGSLGSVRVGRSDAAIQKLGQDLLERNNKSGLPTAIQTRLPKNASVFLLGDFWDDIEIIAQNFQTIRAQTPNGFVIQIVDPAELHLPYHGRVIFESPAFGSAQPERERIDNVHSIAGIYYRRVKDHNEALQQLCHDLGWHYILHSTDQNIGETIGNIWFEMDKIKRHYRNELA